MEPFENLREVKDRVTGDRPDFRSGQVLSSIPTSVKIGLDPNTLFKDLKDQVTSLICGRY